MDTPSPLDCVLRTATFIAFFPALALLIPHGVIACIPIPALGLIPAFFSAVFSLFSLKSQSRFGHSVLYIDMFLAISLISILIPFWVLSASRWQWDQSAGGVMLGTYGTMPLLMDFWIHVFFVFRHVLGMWRSISLVRTCPNCRTHIGAGIIPSITRVSAEKPRHSCESEALYQPLDTAKYEDEARVSSEAGTLYRPSVDTLGSTETVVKLI